MGPYEFDPDDCNNNDVPDEQDIESGASSDIDENGIPDECQSDCNNNDIPDSYEISEGLSDDCNGNGIPDECPGEPGDLPITQQPVSQEVEVGDFVFFNIEADGDLLEYQWRKDRVELVDSERIFGSTQAQLVIFDIVPEDAGDYDCVVADLFGNCATSDAATLTVLTTCPADMNDDGMVGPIDLAMLLGAWGPCADPDACPADLNADATVDPLDLATLLGTWGPCP